MQATSNFLLGLWAHISTSDSDNVIVSSNAERHSTWDFLDDHSLIITEQNGESNHAYYICYSNNRLFIAFVGRTLTANCESTYVESYTTQIVDQHNLRLADPDLIIDLRRITI